MNALMSPYNKINCRYEMCGIKRSYICNATVRKLQKCFRQGQKHDNPVFY